jgi:hypothetical protein
MRQRCHCRVLRQTVPALQQAKVSRHNVRHMKFLRIAVPQARTRNPVLDACAVLGVASLDMRLSHPQLAESHGDLSACSPRAATNPNSLRLPSPAFPRSPDVRFIEASSPQGARLILSFWRTFQREGSLRPNSPGAHCLSRQFSDSATGIHPLAELRGLAGFAGSENSASGGR